MREASSPNSTSSARIESSWCGVEMASSLGRHASNRFVRDSSCATSASNWGPLVAGRTSERSHAICLGWGCAVVVTSVREGAPPV